MARDSALRVLFTVPPSFIMWPQGVMQLESTIPSCGLYTLAAVVEAAGHSCTVLDPVEYWRFHRTGEQLAATAREHDVVCLSANSIIWPAAIPLIKQFAQVEPRPTIVVGGLHPTYCDEHVMQTTEADIVVRGEGEKVLVQLLDALSGGGPLDGIRGLTYRHGGGLARTPDAMPLTEEEISATPLPLWDRLPPGIYGFIPVEMSRGCKFGCEFCSIHHKHCWRSVDSATFYNRTVHAASFAPLVRQRTLMLTDDCFTADPHKAQVIEQALGDVDPSIGVGIEARAPDVLNPTTMRYLKNSRVDFIQVGVECGYAEGLKKIRKGITLEQVVASAHALHEAGLTSQVKYSYIVGFPWESTEQIMRTLSFAMALSSRYGNRAQVNWLMLVPGSAIYQRFLEQGRVSITDFDVLPMELKDFFGRTHPTLGSFEVEQVHFYAGLLEQAYPWVGALGNVFRSWHKHSHTPFSRSIPGAAGREPGGPEISYWEQLPPVFHSSPDQAR